MLRAAASIPQGKMQAYVTASGGNLGIYKGMKQYLEAVEPGELEGNDGFDVDNYMPDEVGVYDLRGQKPNFRKLLAMKAAEVIKRGTSGAKIDEDNMLKTMIALIKAINNKRSKEGLDLIPNV